MRDPVGTEVQEMALRESRDRFVRCAVAIGGLVDGRRIAEMMLDTGFERLEYEREQRRIPGHADAREGVRGV